MSVTTYTMSCFKLPRHLHVELKYMMANYVGCKDEKNKFHLVSQKKMLNSKQDGRMGSSKTWMQNNDKSTLLHKIFKPKYCLRTSFFNSKLGQSLFYTWRGIWEVRTILIQECRWRMGKGVKQQTSGQTIGYQILNPFHKTRMKLDTKLVRKKWRVSLIILPTDGMWTQLKIFSFTWRRS